MTALPSSAWGCNISDGCDIPAPKSDIFFEYETLFEIWFFKFDKPMLLILIAVVLVAGFFIFAFRKPTIVPRGTQNLAELAYNFIRDMVQENIGKAGERFIPFLFSLFFFVWVMNFMGIFPLTMLPPTAYFAVPVALALIVYLTWVPLGMIRQGPWGFFKNIMFPPGLPKPLYILLTPIELISNLLVRPFTHSVRLFANMFAGHLLLVTFSALAWFLATASLWILTSALSFTVVTALTGLELLIQALQAYIFTLLTAVYISDALSGEH